MIAKFLMIGVLAQAAAAAPPPADETALTLRINLPEYRLEVWDGEERIRSYDATIGAPGHSTPQGEFEVDRIIWNPWWNPPDSPWARGKKKTPPGPSNPMGRAKLQFGRLLYIHGTTNTDQLGQARSHGCIRLANEDVLDLARLLALRTAAVPAEDIEGLEANGRRTRDVALPAPVRLEIRYDLVEEEDGEIREHEDVYEKGLNARERWLLEQRSAGSGLASNKPAA